MDDLQAMALGIALNRTAELAEWQLSHQELIEQRRENRSKTETR